MDLRKGLSPIVAELLLIAISVALAAIIYAWVSVLVAKLQNPILMKLIYPSAVSTPWGDCYPGSCSHLRPTIVLMYSSPSSMSISSVYVTYGGSLLCKPALVPSGTPQAEGLCAFGYYGSQQGEYDNDDAPAPGAMLFDKCNSAAGGSVDYLTALEKAVAGYQNDLASPWWTIIAGTWVTTSVAPGYTETSFQPTNVTVKFAGLTGISVKVAYYPATAQWLVLNSYKSASVGRGSWSVVLWCPQINTINYDEVVIHVVINGMDTSVKVPLAIS